MHNVLNLTVSTLLHILHVKQSHQLDSKSYLLILLIMKKDCLSVISYEREKKLFPRPPELGPTRTTKTHLPPPPPLSPFK